MSEFETGADEAPGGSRPPLTPLGPAWSRIKLAAHGEYDRLVFQDRDIFCAAVLLRRRRGGFMLAVPLNAFPAAQLNSAEEEGYPGVMGPGLPASVDAYPEDQEEFPSTCEVLLLDLAAAAKDYLHRFEELDDLLLFTDPDGLVVWPGGEELETAAADWIHGNSGDTSARTDAYLPPAARRLPVAAAAPTAKARAGGRGRTPPPPPPAGPREVADMVSSALAPRFASIEQRLGEVEARRSGVAGGPRLTLGVERRAGQDAPKSFPVPKAPGRLGDPLAGGAPPAAGAARGGAAGEAVARFDIGSEAHSEDGNVQSQILAALTRQSAALQSALEGARDPLSAEGESLLSGSLGVRGAAQRDKYLHARSAAPGQFAARVAANMQRELGPSSSAEGAPPDPLAYFERYAAFGGRRDLGMVHYTLMHMLRDMWSGNPERAQDTAALLACAVEQAQLDGGRWDIANLFLLLPDPPAHALSRQPEAALARPFPRLADQQWCTTFLAYVKELDTIQARRSEVGGRPQRPPRGRGNDAGGAGADPPGEGAQAPAAGAGRGKKK